MNHVFPIEPPDQTTMMFGVGILLVLAVPAVLGMVLPLVAGVIVSRSSGGLRRTHKLVFGGASIVVWLTFALPLVLVAGAVARSVVAATSATFTVTPDALVLSGDWWGRSIPRSSLRASETQVVNVNGGSPLQPVIRTFGTGMPGYGSGWFRLRNGDKALVYMTRPEDTVVVPTTLGYTVLLTPHDARGLVDALQSD